MRIAFVNADFIHDKKEYTARITCVNTYDRSVTPTTYCLTSNDCSYLVKKIKYVIDNEYIEEVILADRTSDNYRVENMLKQNGCMYRTALVDNTDVLTELWRKVMRDLREKE